MEIPLHVGPLKANGYNIRRSGVCWLCEPGQMCQAGQPIAYFNINLEPAGARSKGPLPFAEERELQVVCAPRVGGRVRFDSAAAPGGLLNFFGISPWNAEDVLGWLEIDETSADPNEDAERLRLLMLAGRRMMRWVDIHSGLLPGFNGRVRGWWNDKDDLPFTLLSLGVCDLTGVILGEQRSFLEMFRCETAPTQLVFIPDHPIAPSATVLLDQLERSAAQFQAISADLYAGLSWAKTAPTASDLMFAGTLLSVLERCPIRETYDLISAAELTRSGPADAVLLTLNAEPPTILRHKTLGYRLNILKHHLAAAGFTVHHWLGSAFEPVSRATEDIKLDYENLITAIEKSTGARVIILNRMSTSGDEDISTYAPFDAPMSATLATIASKEMNLMLHDLADSLNVAIVDVDAIAAEMGGRKHLPDGVHHSKAMQDVLRAELLHILNDFRPEGNSVKSLQTRPA